uniref:Zgc:163061 n=1 Tax=Paramormyrops kingsleyae TaxID=1676925 RepID=A0A3B3RJP5_9TELE
MGEVARAKAPKKKAKSKKNRGVGEMIVKAVSASNERSGVSLYTLKQVLAADGYNVEKNNYRIILSIRTLVTKGTLVRIRGVGASGSFKLNDQTKTEHCHCTESEQSKDHKRCNLTA